MRKILISIGDKSFFSDLYENEIAKSVSALFPLNLQLDKVEQEYFSPLAQKLFGKAKESTSIFPGDITVCNSISVGFYTGSPKDGLNTVTIGHISNIEGFTSALAENSNFVTIDFAPADMAAIA